MKLKKFNKILFLGRHNCPYTYKVLKFLRIKSKIVYFYKSKKIGENLNIQNRHLKCDYIFCFRSYFILRKKHLDAPKFKAINFHPSTPSYRGSGGVNFAIYNKENFFGCTAHIINEKIDDGPILNVRRFKVKKNEGVEEVLKKTHKCLFMQAKNIISKLYKSSENLEKMITKSKKEKWSKFSKKNKDLNDFYQISLKSSKKDFKQKILATKYFNFKPHIIFNSKKFILDE